MHCIRLPALPYGQTLNVMKLLLHAEFSFKKPPLTEYLQQSICCEAKAREHTNAAEQILLSRTILRTHEHMPKLVAVDALGTANRFKDISKILRKSYRDSG